MKKRLALLALAAAAAVATAGGTTRTGAQDTVPMLTATETRVSIRPLISVGETLPNGYVFESNPDGIAVYKAKRRHLGLLYVNHETSLVPFPANLSDMTNSILSRLAFDMRTRRVFTATYAIPSTANWQRFCSNFLVRREHGFQRPLVLTNEEATDRVNRQGQAWPAGPNAEQAGVVVAYDVLSGRHRPIYGMGRHNHENAVGLPGYGRPVVLSGDDTFNAPASQLYLYLARNGDDVWNDRGALYAFKSDDAAVNDYGDLSGTRSVSGTFIPVPREVALGDQDALENWSNANGVFQFIRVEDIAYDRRQTNVVYFADTGEPRALPNPATGRLQRGPATARGAYPNGRIFRMVLDRSNPLRVTSLSILIDGDARGAAGAGDLSLIHNPDNVETTSRALLIQEDPGTQNQYAANDANGTTARIWRYELATRRLAVVARVNQSADAAAAQGTWESSGIVDARPLLPRGWFFTAVQAHSLFVTREQRGAVTFKREGGQLLAIRIPGT